MLLASGRKDSVPNVIHINDTKQDFRHEMEDGRPVGVDEQSRDTMDHGISKLFPYIQSSPGTWIQAVAMTIQCIPASTFTNQFSQSPTVSVSLFFFFFLRYQGSLSSVYSLDI